MTSAITITFCDQGENHTGMQKLGKMAEHGFSLEDFRRIKLGFPDLDPEIYELNWPLRECGIEPYQPAYLMVIKAGLYSLVDGFELWSQLSDLKWDREAFMYGHVVNKLARHNLCFADFSQEPNYESGKGRVVDFTEVPLLSELRSELQEITGRELIAEGNHYYDVTKCGIGFHGDAERRVVVGARLGANLPLEYQWYLNIEPVGQRMRFDLEDGDLYFMSEKAVGTDWKRRKVATLRHAAGSEGFLKEK